MIMCAALAEKYGMLPSEIQTQANTFDLIAYDLKSTWEEYHSLDKKGQAAYMTKHMSAQDMLEIMNKAKNHEHKNNGKK